VCKVRDYTAHLLKEKIGKYCDYTSAARSWADKIYKRKGLDNHIMFYSNKHYRRPAGF
jgi:hypothetical protein